MVSWKNKLQTLNIETLNAQTLAQLDLAVEKTEWYLEDIEQKKMREWDTSILVEAIY